MAWMYLLVAGALEVVWSVCMKLSDGFTNSLYTLMTVGGLILSFGSLLLATKSLPIGVAYPCWTGIGAVGSVIAGVVIFKDHLSVMSWLFVALLIVSLIGLKITSQA